ncbi:MAG: EVE domain-containing protein [Xanthomonadaceae bacterium]|nr:EVE domain-containing protein [Xanthomonadaceae bacterium]MDE1885762.1 EVE domain-containing protein [Xanthomonadaceae bacterium]MDE1960878.1 EVE domain-containing protein [Xanthomonadaceae bacterium]MDE2085506.1 EVE domain-containing protein [Xanthomonadaceae bacterium]MDE2257798.1 EVE domain-containing protein [Xanthomonadaceae bacterium]
MNHWLMKSEPDEFSIDDLARRKIEPWSGVRNYQARNHMRGMRIGDGVLFYHSSCAEPGVAGVAAVASVAYPDPTQFDPRSDYFDPKSARASPRWSLVEVKFKRKLTRVIALSELKNRKELQGLALIRPGNRLSVLPMTLAQWNFILGLE